MYWVEKMGSFVVYVLEIVLSYGELGLMQKPEFSWFLFCVNVLNSLLGFGVWVLF